MRRRLAIGVVATALLYAPSASAWRPHIHEAVRYAKERQGFVSIAAIDTEGRFYGYRPHHRAPTASVLKPMLLAGYLRKSDVRHRRLRRWEKRLLSAMIRRSDNDAAGRVLALDGAGAVKRLARRAGMRSFHLIWNPWGLSRTTPRDQARFFYRYDSLLPRRHRRFAGWGGGTGWADHQVAWLEHRGQRVSVAIFTQHNPSHRYGNETLRGVAGRLLRGLPR